MTVLIIGVGFWSFSRLPVDAYPDLSPTMVEIITQWPGRATEEVERLITVPVEVEMNGLPRMQVIRSISLYGLSDVTMTFTDGVDDYFARQQVFGATSICPSRTGSPHRFRRSFHPRGSCTATSCRAQTGRRWT